MNKTSRIFVAGHRGLAGSAIVRELQSRGFDNILLRSRAELDLTDQTSVRRFFEDERPDYVFLCAAKVGGILANSTYPAEFIHQNLAIQTNVIHESCQAGVQRLIFLGSSCIYPRDCPQPIREDYLLTGPLELSNRPYAVAKIAGIEMCWSYNRQYRTKYLAVMPTNLYGPGDNFHPQNSHVLPGMVRKMHEARVGGGRVVVLWGTGKPRRELLSSLDMASAAVFLMELEDHRFEHLLSSPTAPPLVNIGCGEDVTIRQLAEIVREAVGFCGKILWDDSKPDGTPQKLLDTSRLFGLGWRPAIPLRPGIEMLYADFLKTTLQSVAV